MTGNAPVNGGISGDLFLNPSISRHSDMPVVAPLFSLRLFFLSSKRAQLEQVRKLSNNECFKMWLLVPIFGEPHYICEET